MASFYDTLAWSLPKSHPFRHYLEDCTVFFIQNVAEYTFQTIDNAKHWTLGDIPSIMPPLSPMFLEYRIPAIVTNDAERRVGVHVRVEDASEARSVSPELVAFVREKHARWLIVVVTAVESDRDGVMPLSSQFIPVGQDGVADAAALFGTLTHGDAPKPEGFDEMNERARNLGWQYSLPALLAIGFTHCKNVTITQERPPDWQQKAAQRKHGRPLVNYHVLNIEPMKTVLRTEGDVEHNGLKKALHICRGHFKTYSTDKPLFGKITGTYWWPAHVRGSSEVGVTLKDYNVRAPKSQTT